MAIVRASTTAFPSRPEQKYILNKQSLKIDDIERSVNPVAISAALADA